MVRILRYAPLSAMSTLIIACGLELVGRTGASDGTAKDDAGAQVTSDPRTNGAPSQDAGLVVADAASMGDSGKASDADVPLLMSAVDPGVPSCAGAASPLGPLAIPRRRGSAVAVNGLADDWPAKPVWTSITTPFGSKEPVPPSVCAEFTGTWDLDAIYFYLRVADTLHPSPIINDPYHNDAIELFIGAKSMSDGTGVYRVDDAQLIVDVHGAGYLQRGTTNASRDSMINRSYGSNPAEFEFVAKRFPWGYSVEVRVARAVLGESTTPLSINSVYPFTMGVDNGLRTPDATKDYYLWRFDKMIESDCLPGGAKPFGFCCKSKDIGAYCNTRFFDQAKLAP